MRRRDALYGRVSAALAIVVVTATIVASAWAADALVGGPLPRELAGTWSVLAGDRTLPGNFQNPTGVAVSVNGIVYVDDTQNFRIEKLSVGGQVLATFGDAGAGYGQFRFANGLTVDRAGDIYVADTQNARIQKFSPRGYPVGVWDQSGAKPGEFESPSDVAVDSAGNMYVADWGTHRIQKLSPQGKPLASWGSAHPSRGALKLLWPAGVAVSARGTIYVSDKSLGEIVKISPQGKIVAIWGGKHGAGGEFLEPQHVALDAVGHLFVADAGHHRVVELSANGKELRSWRLGSQAQPNGVAVSRSGTLLVTDSRRSEVLQYNLTTSSLISTWGRDERARGEFFFPSALALGPAGALNVADEGNARIEQIPTSVGNLATAQTVWNMPGITARRIEQPVSVAADAAGDIYVVDARPGGVAKLRASGTPVPAWPARHTPIPADPIGVTVDSTGDVYIADGTTSRIWRFDSAGRLLSRWGSGRGEGPGQFQFDKGGPAGIAGDLRGHIYIADTGNNRIEKFTTGGTLVAVWNKIGGFPDTFSTPRGIAVDGGGNVYIANTSSNQIDELSASGTLIARWGSQGSTPGQFRSPSGVAVDSAGRIYVADSNNDRVQIFTPVASAVPSPVVRVSTASPLAACKLPIAAHPAINREAETRLAVNPATVASGHVSMIGVWIQGLSVDDVAAYSADNGSTWQETPLPFSRCAQGGLPFTYASDPWVSIGPDGTAYMTALGDTTKKVGKHSILVDNGIELATSRDGGRTWTDVQSVGRGSSQKGVKTEVDKPTVVADPVHPGTAYTFWDSLDTKGGFTGWMVKTTDGGKSWTSPRAFLPAHPDRSMAALHQPLIDPRTGTIYDFFWYSRIYPKYVWHCHKVRGSVTCGPVQTDDSVDYIAFVRSRDRGATWSAPHIVAQRYQMGFFGIGFGANIRTGIGMDVALDPENGSLHAVWTDATYNFGAYDQVLSSSSSDGGADWSPPVRVTQFPAFNPSVTVNASGTIAVTYYAVRQSHAAKVFRQIRKHPGAIVTYLIQTSSDGGKTFTLPRPLFGAFNINRAMSNGQFFLGDYQGLAAAQNVFHPFFVASTGGKVGDPVDVFTAAVQPPPQ